MEDTLIKCLKCRLIGAPPAFNLPPPPAPPMALLFASAPSAPAPASKNNIHTLFNQRQASSLNQHQAHKRCPRVKAYMRSVVASDYNTRTKHQPRIQPAVDTPRAASGLSATLSSIFAFDMSQAHTVLVFTAFVVLLLAALVATLVVLVKLCRLRKRLDHADYHTTKSSKHTDTDHNSLASSSTSTSPKSFFAAATDATSTKTNTIGSSANFAVVTNYDEHHAATASALFYNQLFESTRQHLIRAQNNDATASGNSNSSMQSQDRQYLQAVPNVSNLIETHIGQRLVQLQQQKQHQQQRQQRQQRHIDTDKMSEYDEITSQACVYDRSSANPVTSNQQQQQQNIYNQYDDSSVSIAVGVAQLSTSGSSSSSSSVSSTKPLIYHQQQQPTIVQPIMPIPMRHSACFVNNNNNHNSNTMVTANNALMPFFHHINQPHVINAASEVYYVY